MNKTGQERKDSVCFNVNIVVEKYFTGAVEQQCDAQSSPADTHYQTILLKNNVPLK